jgi:uncharacterized protein (TIGR02996 family)
MAAIATNRGDATTYRLYGDWLESQGDPRGELIALHQMLDASPDDRDLLRYIAGYLWRHRSLVPVIDPWRSRYEWRWGFIVAASLDRPTIADVEMLLLHPSCALLQRVSATGVSRSVHARLERARPMLASLEVEVR